MHLIMVFIFTFNNMKRPMYNNIVCDLANSINVLHLHLIIDKNTNEIIDTKLLNTTIDIKSNLRYS